MNATPAPRLARALLRLCLSREAAEVIVGDLEEAFAADIARRGRRQARRRYWQMTLRSLIARWRPSLRRASTDTRPRPWGSGLFRDLKDGAKQLGNRPGIALAIAGTLAMGIAATTTVFGVTNALLFKPLAYHDPGRVVFLLGWNTEADQMAFNLRYIDARDLAARMTSLARVSMYRGWDANLSDAGLPERVQAYAVSVETFEVLGIPAALGRTFGAADAAGDGRVVVLSHGLWARRFAGDPAIVGREISLNGRAHTVLGVMPASFEFPVFNFKGDAWTPLQPEPSWAPAGRTGSPSIVAIGRVADGVALASAQAEADAIMAQLAQAHPEANGTRGVRVVPMGQLGREQAGPAFAVLGAAALLVLLIACTNAASLELARGFARGREVAVRAALGASRRRLVRQFLIESTWLALAGGAGGIVLASFALQGLRRALPDFVVRVLPGIDLVRIDVDGMLFACGAALATVLIFGALPAWRATSGSAADVLRAGGRSATDSQRTWLRSGLIVAEVAVAAALLVMTGLLARTAANLEGADPGFDKDRVLALSVSLPAVRYATAADVEMFYSRLAERVSALPGVTEVGDVNALPFSTSNETIEFTVAGDTTTHRADYRASSPGYLPALGVALARGRAFTVSDNRPGADVALVNEAFARRYYPDVPAVGRELRLDDGGDAPVTIVGVAADARHWTLSDAVTPAVFVPSARDPRRQRSLAVRTDGDPAALAGAVRAAAAEVDPQQALYDVTPLSRLVENSFIPQRLTSGTLVVFGIVALLLTCFGLHALLAFVVARRTQEIGLRVALGATPSGVLRLVLGRSLFLTGAGLLIGLGLALAGAQGLASLLYGVGPFDPVSYAGAAAVIGLVTLVASWLPARRALGVDPVVALRAD